jgi:CPA2 family monovalent cation:H+ antiporter-2
LSGCGKSTGPAPGWWRADPTSGWTADHPPVALTATGLALVTALTKLATGWWAARRAGIATLGRFRAGAALVARGEFSIVIAGLAVTAGLDPALGPLAATYVLVLAVLGPILARIADPLVMAALRLRQRRPQQPAPRPSPTTSAGNQQPAATPHRRGRECPGSANLAVSKIATPTRAACWSC